MATAKFCGLALLQLASFGDAQLVFMLPQRSGEIAQREQPSQVSFTQISALGSDGQMHTQTHKVFTETSSDGMQKRISEVDCKDGDCSKSVSRFFRGFPGMFNSMAPSNIFSGMPRAWAEGIDKRMPRIQEKLANMQEKLEHPPDGTASGFRLQMPMRVMHCMHHMHQKMMHHMHGMHHMMFRFGSGQGDQKMPEMPMHRVTLHFLAPRDGVPTMAPPLMAAEPTSIDGDVDVPVEVQVVAGLGFVSFLFLFIVVVRSCLFGKAEARERPLQELGQPLAPEGEAELGMAPGVVVRPQALADFVKDVKAPSTPTQMYLLDLYARAGKPSNEAELASVVLRDVYAAAVARATAA